MHRLIPPASVSFDLLAMPNLRHLLHFVLNILLMFWLGVGAAAVQATEVADCCHDASAPCCVLAAGGCAMSAPCPGVALPSSSQRWSGRPRPVVCEVGGSDRVVLPLWVDEIWRPPDRDER
jgi:hypothetical protein